MYHANPSPTFGQGDRPETPTPSQEQRQQSSAGPYATNAPIFRAVGAAGEPCNSAAAYPGRPDNSSLGATSSVAPLGGPTGLDRFYDATGGLRGRTVLAGPRECGRSALALNVARLAVLRDPETVALIVTYQEDVDEQRIRLLAIESRTPANRIRTGKMDPAETEAYHCAFERIRNGIGRRLHIVEAIGPWPADYMALVGKPFDLNFVLAERARLIQSTGASRCLIVIDPFKKIGVPHLPNLQSLREKELDDEYDRVRVDYLDRLCQMTATAARPEGDPQIVVADVAKLPRARPPFMLRNGLLGQAANRIAFLEPQHVTHSDDGSVARSVLWLSHRVKIAVDFDLARYSFVEASDATAGDQDD